MVSDGIGVGGELMWCYRDLDHMIGMIGLVVARDGENVQRQREVRRRRRRRRWQRPRLALDGSLDAAPGTIAGAGSREGGGGTTLRLVYRYRACESPAGHSSGNAVPRAEGVTFASGSGGMRMEKGRAQPLRANLYSFACSFARAC